MVRAYVSVMGRSYYGSSGLERLPGDQRPRDHEHARANGDEGVVRVRVQMVLVFAGLFRCQPPTHQPVRSTQRTLWLAACNRRAYAKRGSDWALTIMGGWHPAGLALKNETATLGVLLVSFNLTE